MVIDVGKIDLSKYVKTARMRTMDGQKNQPWRIYRELKEGSLMTPQQLLDIMLNCPKRAAGNIRTLAQISYIYLFSLRIGEAVRYKYKGKYAPNGVELMLPSPKVKDVWGETKPDGSRWLWAKIRRQKSVKIRNDVVNALRDAEPEKFLAIKQLSLSPRIDKIKVLYSGVDAKFIDMLEKYIDKLRSQETGITAEQKLQERELFPFSRMHGQHSIKNILGFPPHYLRVLRASHLVVYKQFSASDLQKFVGWATPLQALEYANSNEYLLEKRFEDAAKSEVEDSKLEEKYQNFMKDEDNESNDNMEKEEIPLYGEDDKQ